MTDVDRYLEAATRANTQRSYASATRHFEVEFGGLLPATGDGVARYLSQYADRLSVNTLKNRLAALAQWHTEHGFADPTRTPLVRKVLKGIQALHPRVEKRAEPLQIRQLGQVVAALERSLKAARKRGDSAEVLRLLRDRALVLLGFWRGFRSDELIRARVEHIKMVAGQGMTIFLPQSKNDRQNLGKTYRIPALSRWCPVKAITEWMTAASLKEGPLFPGIDRWGHVSADSLHPNSIIPLLRRVFGHVGLEAPDQYTGHSLRRGFAGWANANGWDVKALMEYIGWKDVHSAMRYIDGADAFAQRFASLEAQSTTRALPAPGGQSR
jgi:integrase